MKNRMRWVFAALVLANIGLLMWASWYRLDPGSMIPPRPVFHPELMVPLSAPGVALKSRRNERNGAPLVATKPKMRCVVIGPFAADAHQPAAGALAAERLEHTRRVEEYKVESNHWVYLGPFKNRKQAEARKRELEKLGVRELLIMQDAQGEVAISLGLFTQPDNARNRAQELAEKGIEAKQEIRYRNENRIWFDLRLPEPADEPLARLRARSWGDGVEVRDSACPTESPTPPAPPATQTPPASANPPG